MNLNHTTYIKYPITPTRTAGTAIITPASSLAPKLLTGDSSGVLGVVVGLAVEVGLAVVQVVPLVVVVGHPVAVVTPVPPD